MFNRSDRRRGNKAGSTLHGNGTNGFTEDGEDEDDEYYSEDEEEESDVEELRDPITIHKPLREIPFT